MITSSMMVLLYKLQETTSLRTRSMQLFCFDFNSVMGYLGDKRSAEISLFYKTFDSYNTVSWSFYSAQFWK